MKIDKPVNENYAAIVTPIRNIVELPNCDNVVGTTLFGLQAIVNKETKVGDIGLFFPAEVQLSDEYCYNNNLYRHADKNKVESEKGYIEDNRRVKAVKFRGNLSSCLFMPLTSLEWTGIKVDELREGDTFDVLNGHKICEKYVIHRGGHLGGTKAKEEKFVRVDLKFLPENPDVTHFLRMKDTLDPESYAVVTQKLHGTSIRIGNTIVKRKLKLVERLAKLFGGSVLESEHDYVYGSRRVIKDINNPNQNHFYKEDIWTREGSKLKGILPENFLVYAELVGYTEDGGEIQKGYTYHVPAGTSEMYVYRIAVVNNQGFLFDLTWEQLKEFCTNNGLRYVPELWSGKLKDLKVEDFLEKRFFEEGYRNALFLGEDKSLVDEGICIRIGNMTPQIFKAKSQIFLEYETKMLDQGVEDLESTQSDETNTEETNQGLEDA